MKSSVAAAATAVVLFFGLLFLYTKVAGPLPIAVTSTVTQKNDIFAVSGEGKSTVVPDIAVVNTGVQVNGTNVKQVQNELNTKISAVSEAIKKLGIDAKDIQTSGYSIYPNYDYTNGSQKINGYQASTSLTIKVRDLDKANDVIDAATANGANQVGGVTFSVDDRTKAENEARDKAVAEAKTKAEQAAQIAGFKLGKIINYSESFGGLLSPVPMMYARDAGAEKAATQTTLEPGSNEINISVTLQYEIL